jgi:hypothetical protein
MPEPLTEQPKPRTGYFAELADLREATLDSEQFIARGVTLIRPGFSSNADRAGRHRYYPAATLEAAAAKYDGTRAYFNHPTATQSKELPERDVRDIAGYFKNVKAGPGGALVGDLHILGQAREIAWPLIAEAAAHKPDLIQLSSNAIGQTVVGEAEGQKALIVESIVGVNSVDLVTTGAAGGTFAGARLESDGDSFTRELLSAMSYDEWRESRPEFFEQLKKEVKTTRDDAALKEARTERDTKAQELTALREQYRADLTELVGYRRGELADRLLEASNLPHSLRAKVRADLLTEADAAAMAARLAREADKYAAAPRQPVPVSGSGAAPVARPGAVSMVAPANKGAALFGMNESLTPRPDESAEAYRARRAQLTS